MGMAQVTGACKITGVKITGDNWGQIKLNPEVQMVRLYWELL
jgi:hypothetical protein